MEDDTILLLAGIGIVGYGLLKSDFFKGVGDVGTGVGDAFAGVGAGVGQVGQSIGLNASELLGVIGQMSRTSTDILREGGTHTQTIIREIGKDTTKTADNIGNIPVNVSKAGSDLVKSSSNIITGFSNALDYTWNLDRPTNIFRGIGSGINTVVNKIIPKTIPTTTVKISSIKTPTIPTYNNSSSKSNDLINKMRQQGTAYLNRKK